MTYQQTAKRDLDTLHEFVTKHLPQLEELGIVRVTHDEIEILDVLRYNEYCGDHTGTYVLL